MWADTTCELHVFAEKIGMKLAWFQDHPIHPHYDLRKSKYLLAIQQGAKIYSYKQFLLDRGKHDQ